jgi:hypothetical protein
MGRIFVWRSHHAKKIIFFRMEEGEFKVKINKRARCFGIQGLGSDMQGLRG